MKTIDKIYVNGVFITPHGTEEFDLINPSTNEIIGKVTLGDEEDTRLAIKSAKEAFKQFSKTTKEDRIAYLQRLYDTMGKRNDELVAMMVQEYGGTLQFCRVSVKMAIYSFANAIETLQKFDFVKKAGSSMVRLEPTGVAGIITPWNASNAFI